MIHQLLLGEHNFYDDVFASLRIPYEPIRWETDITTSHEDQVSKQARVHELIHAYRTRGHLMADTDPLEYHQRSHPDLDISTHGLTLWDLDREFASGSTFALAGLMKLRDILGVLRDTYCRTVGIEYMHMQDPRERVWIQERVERTPDRLPRDEQLRVLRKLNEAEAFETFLQTKYVGQKRFSLEGGESVIALLDAVLVAAAQGHLDEVAIGMPHRGRLNVLANIVGKSYGQIFREFEGNLDPKSMHGSGDVKYHLGADGRYKAHDGSEVSVSLAANPSHLEAVNPVLEGIVRAKQDIVDRGESGFTVLPVLMHGDAAFAGQGVVAETLELSQLRGYRTGGTIHVIVNNQVGLHHRSGREPVEPVRDRRRAHGAGTDLPRERRRPRGMRARRATGVRIPPGVQEGRRHRHDLLPPPRSQRGRRPVDDAAADVRPHRPEALGAQAVHRGPDRPRRHHAGRGRGRAEGLPGPAGEGVRRHSRRADDPDDRRLPLQRAGRRRHRAAQQSPPRR